MERYDRPGSRWSTPGCRHRQPIADVAAAEATGISEMGGVEALDEADRDLDRQARVETRNVACGVVRGGPDRVRNGYFQDETGKALVLTPSRHHPSEETDRGLDAISAPWRSARSRERTGGACSAGFAAVLLGCSWPSSASCGSTSGSG